MKSTTAFTDKVAQLMQREGLDFSTAWGEARRRQPALFARMDHGNSGRDAVNELPPGAQLSGDSQRLTADWPVPPAALGALGLPTSATREQFEIFKAGDRVKEFEPEIAAKVFVTLVRYAQLAHGAGFDSAAEAVRRNFPDLLAALRKLDHVELIAPVKAANPADKSAANEITTPALVPPPQRTAGGETPGFSPVFPFVVKPSTKSKAS